MGVAKERGEDEPEVIEHESFGTISVSHITSGRGEVLFGSSIRHSQIIRIEVGTADLKRDLHRDWIHGGIKPLIQVDLSYSQFTEFVTTHNRGTGIPCTIRYFNGREMEEPPFTDKREQHRQEFKKSTDKIARKLDELHAAVAATLEKPSVTKQERKDLLERVRYARQCIESDLPFAVTQFDEQMDLSIKEAKGEIEGFALRRVLMAGMAAIEAEGHVDPPMPALMPPEEGEAT